METNIHLSGGHITHVLDGLQSKKSKRARTKKAHSIFDARTDAMLERMLEPHGYFPGPGHVKGIDLSSRTMEVSLTLISEYEVLLEFVIAG